MTPNIALSLCLIVIGTLFVREITREDGVSPALWFPAVWTMYCGSRPLEYWFNPEALSSENIDYTEGSALDRAFLSALIIAGLFILARRKSLAWSRILSDNVYLWVFFAYMLLSICWSDYPAVSLKRWVRTVGDLVMAIVVLTDKDPLEAVGAVLRRSAFVLLPISIILVKYFRAIGIEYTEDGLQTMWVGVTTQKNVLGYVAMMCGLYFVSNLAIAWKKGKAKGRIVDSMFLVLALVLLGGSSSANSKTSLCGFALGVCLLLVFHLSARNPNDVGKYLVGGGSLLVGLGVIYVLLYGSMFEALGRDSTMTGRADIWDVVLAIGPRNPLFGRGYGSFWIGDVANDVWSKIYTPIRQSHNGYIDIYVELGAFGVALLALLIVSIYRNIRQTFRSRFEYGTMRLVLLAVIVVHNITESSFARPTHLLWFLFLLIGVSVPSAAALCGNMSEAVTPWELNVEGEQGSETDGRDGDGDDVGRSGGGGGREGEPAAIHDGVQAKDRPGRGRV